MTANILYFKPRKEAFSVLVAVWKLELGRGRLVSNTRSPCVSRTLGLIWRGKLWPELTEITGRIIGPAI